jgi:hypothetical protein
VPSNDTMPTTETQTNTAIKLHPSDAQIVLYAKGHFHKLVEFDDTQADRYLKALLAWRSGLWDVEAVDDFSVIIVLTNLMDHLNLQSRVCTAGFLSQLLYGSRYGRAWPFDKGTPIYRFIDAVLGELSALKVRDNGRVLVELGEVDPGAVAALQAVNDHPRRAV